MQDAIPTPSGSETRRPAGNSPLSYMDQLRTNLEFGRLLRLGVIAAEFALIVAAIRVSNIETESFELILTVALGGFLVHHFLPAAWRQNFFAALSVASVPMVFGWEQGTWLLVMGGVLIALCHLPVAMWARIALVLLTAAVMAATRTQVLPWASYIPAAIWPILGSMFMFRLIVYIYDLKHGSGPFGVGRALSYFFMLPNVCFTLFPVVDYKTFQHSAYNDDPLHLYQTGVKWMLRGFLHLALYKVIYFMAVIEPGEAANGMGAARYMIATYLLYLKISGLFHLIVGLLHMFGFGLAETHHLYLFSSSFTDFWRRINIYWKDFIQKLVFNPTYFSLRKKLGDTGAITVATLIAFAATWLFHSYQWFWIRGEFPIVWADIVFWLGLGVIVLVNVLLESGKGRQRSLKKQTQTLRQGALLALKIAATFTTICILWTIWSTPNFDELVLVWRALLNSGARDLAVLVGVPVGFGVLGALLGHRKREVFGVGAGTAATAKTIWREVAVISIVAGAFIVVALRPLLLVPLSPDLATLVKDVSGRRLNPADSKKLQRGYYEDLGDVTRFNSELWAMYGGRPKGWDDAILSRPRDDGIGFGFIPSTKAVFKGSLQTINSHGMRDREYTLERGTNTFRIALVGASHDAGSGVKDEETYENLVEDRLNRELGAQTGKKFEILNFSHGGYDPTQKLSVIEQQVFRFHPDVVLYVANSSELAWTFKSVPRIVKNQLLDQFPFIKSAMDRADIKVEAGKPLPKKIVLDSKLAPYAEDTLRAVLSTFRDHALSRGIRPALVLLEIPDDSSSREKSFDRLVELAQSAKLPVLDLQGSFAGVRDRKLLWIAPWDSHTNPEGHRLLADRLHSLLVKEGLVPTEALPDAQDRRGSGE